MNKQDLVPENYCSKTHGNLLKDADFILRLRNHGISMCT